MAAISGAAARILVSLPRDHGDARWPFVRFAASPSPNVTIGGVIAAPPVRWGLRCAPGGMVCREPQVPCRFATASRLARPATGRGVVKAASSERSDDSSPRYALVVRSKLPAKPPSCASEKIGRGTRRNALGAATCSDMVASDRASAPTACMTFPTETGSKTTKHDASLDAEQQSARPEMRTNTIRP